MRYPRRQFLKTGLLCLPVLTLHGQSVISYRRRPFTGIATDDFEGYSLGALNSQAGTGPKISAGVMWYGGYVARPPFVSIWDQDDMETYSDGASLNTLNGGIGFPSGYVARNSYVNIYASDDMESYAINSTLNGDNGGTGFPSGYVARNTFVNIYGSDDMESYADGSNLNGANGGTGWLVAFVAR